MSETVSTNTTPEVEKTTAATKTEANKADKKPEKKQKASWFAGIKAEFKKCVWPDKMKVVKSTTAVVLVSIFVAVAVKVSDLLIQAVLGLLI